MNTHPNPLTPQTEAKPQMNSESEEMKDTSGDSSMIGVDTRQLTNIELIREAEECTERLKLERAVALYDEGVTRFPNDTIILDQYTDLLIQFGEQEKAKNMIERSI